MGTKWRFNDLKQRGIVKNRQTLKNWQEKLGFPLGKLMGPNTRVFDKEEEIEPWVAARPTKLKATPKPKRPRGRPRKAHSDAITEQA
jgi:AT hook motif